MSGDKQGAAFSCIYWRGKRQCWGKQLLISHAMLWKLYSNMIDLFIVKRSGRQFPAFPKVGATASEINSHQSRFILPNDAITRVRFVQPFALIWADEFIHPPVHSITPILLVRLLHANKCVSVDESVHSITPIQLIHLPQTNRCRKGLQLGSLMRFRCLSRL